jgi:hypothetical protein
MVTSDRALEILRDPSRAQTLTPAQWDDLVRQARSADLLARLGEMLRMPAVCQPVPAAPAVHVDSTMILAAAQQDEVRREVRHIEAALRPLRTDVVLLKGAAYVLADLPAARGRLFADVDIMVPRACLPEAEAQLMLHGWVSAQHNAYDQRYYREWMHELPPMQHMRRQTVLDVHHTILPPTSRLKPDAGKLFAAAVEVTDHPGLKVLAPVDMVLHSMSHLFHNDELSHGLRDLSDLDLLLRHFGQRPGFWPELVERARELDLTRPLHYGLRYTQRLLATPVPEDAHRAAARWAPSPGLAQFMDAMWLRALRAPHPTTGDALTPFAIFFLYVRAHWLRMPPLMLVRHLSVKAWRRAGWGADGAKA